MFTFTITRRKNFFTIIFIVSLFSAKTAIEQIYVNIFFLSELHLKHAK